MSQIRSNSEAEIHPILANRWSPHAFAADKPVGRETLLACMEAARWAPSCFGDEPWRFIVCDKASDAASWEKLLAILAPKNQEWAKNTPVLLLVCASTQFRSGKPNRWGEYDSGQAAISFCLQAEALGLASHQMGGFDSDAARKTFAIPNDATPMAVIALGYQAAAAKLDEGFQSIELAERKRQPIGSCFFAGTWKKPIA